MRAVVLVKELGSLSIVSTLSLVGQKLVEAWLTLMTMEGKSAAADLATKAAAARAVETMPLIFMLKMRGSNGLQSKGLKRKTDKDG